MLRWDPVPYSLRQLQYLVAVAELGGFRRAAEACGVAQPSLSAQIAQVEGALGVQIFERGARGARVTAAGAPVIERARAVLLASRDLADTARQHSDPLRGTVRIGVIPTVCPYLLPEIAPALRRKLPKLHVIWNEDKTQALLDQVGRGGLDAAILAFDPRLDHLDYAVITDDPFVLAAAPRHPLARRHGPASTDVLEGETVFLLEDGHCFRDQALALCGATGARQSDLTATGLATLVQMVGGGEGVTLLPRLAVPVENRRGQLVVRAFKSPAPTRRLVLAWRRGSAMKRPLATIAGVIREQL
jgi:LysR family transcriptional regulator, hydrogen peroxide-inducible genes activator